MKENKSVINIYSLLDAELARMHILLASYLALPENRSQPYHSYSGSGYSNLGNTSVIYQRIIDLQDILLKVALSADKEIQEKVAELALMGNGDKNET